MEIVDLERIDKEEVEEVQVLLEEDVKHTSFNEFIRNLFYLAKIVLPNLLITSSSPESIKLLSLK